MSQSCYYLYFISRISCSADFVLHACTVVPVGQFLYQLTALLFDLSAFISLLVMYTVLTVDFSASFTLPHLVHSLPF